MHNYIVKAYTTHNITDGTSAQHYLFINIKCQLDNMFRPSSRSSSGLSESHKLHIYMEVCTRMGSHYCVYSECVDIPGNNNI